MTTPSKSHSEIRQSLVRCLLADKGHTQWTGLLTAMHSDLYPVNGMYRGASQIVGEDEAIAYEIVMDLFRTGIIVFRSGRNYEWPFIGLTSMGRRALTDETGWYFTDTETYLDLVRRKVPAIDPISEAYLREASNCYHSYNVAASLVMLGVALEKRFDVMLQGLLLSPNGTAFQPAAKETFFGAKVVKFRNIVQSQNPSPFAKELRDTLSTKLNAILEVIRQARNDHGHPTKLPDADREYVYILLRLFISIAATMQAVSEQS